jgi:zinc-binding in reverse transcriptase
VNHQRNTQTCINYLGNQYTIGTLDKIKINGVVLSNDLTRMKELNTDILVSRMDSHFRQWSKRHLSLLGKVQIYKTYGLSQFLYHLAIFEPDRKGWKNICDKIGKFIWNKNYEGNKAPNRIKNGVMLSDVEKGGFGLLDIKTVIQALRLKRHLKLLQEDVHPLHGLLTLLTKNNKYLLKKTELQIDEVTELNIRALTEKRIADCKAPEWQLEGDLILHYHLLESDVDALVRPRKTNSREMTQLRLRQALKLKDIIGGPINAYNTFMKIVNQNVSQAVRIIYRLYNRGLRPPEPRDLFQLRHSSGSWLSVSSLTTKNIRVLMTGESEIVTPRLLYIERDALDPFYKIIKKLQNINNKTRLLRLLQRDVYCGERLLRFGLAESEQCIRCFQKETIEHLLQSCPYSVEVWKILGVSTARIEDLIGVGLNAGALEIRADLISKLVFSKGVLPPEVLVKVLLEKFAKGIVYKGNSLAIARELLN